jgi:F0F1-type ATP synthase membrane subunit c/vacuolar-type H+-ATPase subunit K
MQADSIVTITLRVSHMVCGSMYGAATRQQHAQHTVFSRLFVGALVADGVGQTAFEDHV